MCGLYCQVFVKTERLLKFTDTHVRRTPWAVVYQMCKIDALLLQSASRKCHMACWIVTFAMTFSTLKVIQLLRGLQVEFIKHQSNGSHVPLWQLNLLFFVHFCVNNCMRENIFYFDTTIFSVSFSERNLPGRQKQPSATVEHLWHSW